MKVMSNSSWPIYVKGPSEIVFNLKAPFQSFPQMWVQFTGLIFDTNYVLEHGGFGAPAAINTYFDTHPIPGTGPYEVTSVSENSYAKFTQNPTYWAKNWTAAQIQANPYMDPGHVKNVVVQTKTDDVARYVDLNSGAAQIAAHLTQDWAQVTSNPSKFSYFVMPNGAANIVGLANEYSAVPHQHHGCPPGDSARHKLQCYRAGSLPGRPGRWPGTDGRSRVPSFTQLYDLGNLSAYQYNVTLAKQDLEPGPYRPRQLADPGFPGPVGVWRLLDHSPGGSG